MNLSPTSSSASTSSSSSSSASNSTLLPNHVLSPAYRRRSVDTGGLNLAVNDHTGSGSGRGYGGWADNTQAMPGSIDYAELVIAMREQTNSIIDQAHPASSTPFHPSTEMEMQREISIQKLSTWHFDASHLPPDEVLLCTTLLFELLWSIEGMQEDISLAFDSIPPFLLRVSKIYREQTSYHNFQHALDVLQAMYCYLHKAGCIPSIEILLDRDPDIATPPAQDDPETDKHEPEVAVPAPRRRRLWRKPRSGERTLLQRTLRNRDLFALFVASIGHDIGHPGLSNAFMKNAKTPLAELFDDTSVLEKMHCTLLLQVMRKHRMAHLLDRFPPHLQQETRFASLMQSRTRTDSDPGVLSRDINVFADQNGDHAEPPRKSPPSTPLPTRPMLKKSASAYPRPVSPASNGTGTEFRNLLMKTILATDMSVHFKWMPKLQELIRRLGDHQESEEEDELGKVTEDVECQTRLLLCQALIKCADISNPSRPLPACKHWSWSLLAEWTQQALLEEQLALPISVSATDDPIQEAEGQVGFIETFTLPLLKATSVVIPEMMVFGDQCEINLSMWQARGKELKSRTATDDNPPTDLTPPVSASSASSPLTLPTSPPDLSTIFALSLPAALYTPNSELRQSPWPTTDPPAHPLSMAMQPEMEEIGHIDGRLDESTLPDSTPPSPLSSSTVPQTSHRRHTSHTELPQVSIPTGPSTSFSWSNQHAQSSSTASASPLFSPRSIPTSTSSPRSEISSSGSGPSATSTALGLQLRPALRAAYDANGRPKAMRRLENRTSWQGTVAISASVAATPDTEAGPAFDSTARKQSSNGS